MAFEEGSNNMYMPVAPAYGGNGMGMGGDWGWIILFLIFGMFGNGWGGNGGNSMYPWLNQSNQINDGFRDQMLNTSINGIQNAVNNGFASAEVASCNRAMAEMERSFAAQTANTQGLFGLQSQLAQCCCENRLATANLGSDIAREACATRTNDTANTQAILNAINGGIQSIKDQLCQDKIDEKNEKILELQNQLNIATFNASQTAQTAQILAARTTATTG